MLACTVLPMIGCGAQKPASQDKSAEQPAEQLSSPDSNPPSIAKLSRAPLEIGSRQDASSNASPFESLPTGRNNYSAELGYATVRVFYATDRAQDALPLSAYQVSGSGNAFFALMIIGTLCGLFAFSLLKGRSMAGAFASAGV